MAYVVLARKYRPQSLHEVIGQDAIVRTLTNAIKQQRIHHAYLFTGARGVGKTSIARILAKSLNCEKGPTDTPCGVCAACLEITRSSSQDVLEIDGASNTSVEDVRDLRETVKYLPSRGKHKIYIIDEVHMLSTSAFNALLKTLEEPPEHVIFVFATTEPQKIPITILSRCQRFDFRRVPPTILAARLTYVAQSEGVKIDPSAIAIVAKAADGSVRDAMSLLDQVIAFCGTEIDANAAQQALGLLDREKVRALMAALLGRDRIAASALVQEAFIAGADLAEIAERLVEAVRDLALAKITKGQAETLSGLMPEELTALLQQAKDVSEQDLHRLFAVLVKTAEDTARSAFAHLTFEMGLLRACDLEPVASLAELVNELRTGSRGSASGGGSSGGGSSVVNAPTAQASTATATGPAAQAAAHAFSPMAPQAGVTGASPSTFSPTPPQAIAANAAPAAFSPTPPVAGATAASPPHRSGASAVEPPHPSERETFPSTPPRPGASAFEPPHPSEADASSSAQRPAFSPTPPPAQADALATKEHPTPTTFRELTAVLKVHKPRLGAACENVVCIAFAPPHVAVRVPKGNEVFGEILLEKDTPQLFANLFGDRLVLAIEAGDVGPDATLAEERRSERQAEVRDLKQAGSVHPAVQKVIQTLGGQIRGVQVRAALSHPAEDYDER